MNTDILNSLATQCGIIQGSSEVAKTNCVVSLTETIQPPETFCVVPQTNCAMVPEETNSDKLLAPTVIPPTETNLSEDSSSEHLTDTDVEDENVSTFFLMIIYFLKLKMIF